MCILGFITQPLKKYVNFFSAAIEEFYQYVARGEKQDAEKHIKYESILR